jgi:hypothetical protein
MATEIKGIDRNLLMKLLKEARGENQATAEKPTPAKPTAKPAEKTPPEKTEKEKDEPRDPPAHTIPTGAVMTRIWARKNALGQVVWSIDQRRYRSDGIGGAVCKSFYPDQLGDAIEGLCEAEKWIKKADKRLNRKRFWS